MNVIDIIVSLGLLGVVGLLCSFLLLINFIKDEIWGIIVEKEESDDRRD